MRTFNLLTRWSAASLLAVCSGCSVLQSGSLDKAQSDFAEGQYDPALRHLSKAQGYATPKPAVAAEIGFLRGLCYDGLNQPAEADASFKSAAAQYPQTDCGFMSKQMLNSRPVDLGPPVEPSATSKGLDAVFGTPVRPFTYFVEAAAISGDGQVLIGEQVMASHFILSSAPTTVNIYRRTKTDGPKLVATLRVPYGTYTPLKLQVSHDGSVIVGNLADANRDSHPFRWTAASGFQDLGKKPGASSTEVDGLSADGSVLAGEYVIGTGTNLHAAYFRWTQARGFEDAGPSNLPPFTLVWICGVSDDGSVLTGTLHLRAAEGNHVFRWTQDAGLQDLGTLGGRSAETLCASPDGSTFVAVARMPDKTSHIIRWTRSGGAHELGVITNESAWPTFASEDGSVVVGNTSIPGSNLPNSVPFRWTAASGLQYVSELGPAWMVNPVGISRDGSKLLYNIYYQMAYQNGGVVVPIGSMFVPISHAAATWVFYQSFTRDFDSDSK